MTETEPRPPRGLAAAYDAFSGWATVAAGIAVVLGLLIPLGWWSELHGVLRPILEALPLGGAVAETPREHGEPILVGFLGALVVAGAIYLVVRWRRRLVHEHVYGGVTFVHVLAVSYLRIAVILGGAALVPILGAIADGADLRDPDPESTFSGPIPVVLVLAAWFAAAFVGLTKAIAREAARGPSEEVLNAIPGRRPRSIADRLAR